MGATSSHVKGTELHSEFALSRIAITHQLGSARVQVLLSVFDAFLKRTGRRDIDDLDTGSRALIYFDAIKTRILFQPARANTPNLPGWKWICPYGVFALNEIVP